MTPTTSNIGGNYNNTLGYLRASPNGEKIAAVYYDNSINTNPIELYEFDNQNGTLNNLKSLTSSTSYYGIEFSPNSELLYISDYSNQNIYQYNLLAGTGSATDIINSEFVVSQNNINGGGALQLGSDGKIYYTIDQSNHLNVINNPNVSGIGCNYNPNFIYLDGKISRLGLPGFVNSYVKTLPQITFNINPKNICLSESLDLNNYVTYPNTGGALQFSLNGVSIPGGLFVANLGVGLYTFTFTYTNPNGTFSSLQQTIKVFDCCSEVINIILDGGNTDDLLQQTNWQTTIINQVIIINNVFTIDQDITFIGCEIHMGYLAEIWVGGYEMPAKLTLDNTQIHACTDSMWQGIYVDNNEIIVKNGSSIEDALEAIVMSPTVTESSYTIKDSYFKNNLYSLVCHPLTYNTSTFIGNTISNNNPLLHNPNNRNWSFTGILLHQTNGLVIGDGSNAAYQNTFSDLKYGIVGLQTDFEVYNNHFENIYANSNASNSLYSFFPSACIYAKGVNPTGNTMRIGGINNYKRNTFSYFRNGIYAEHMNSDIVGNSLSYGDRNGIRTQFTENSTVTNNSIVDVRMGIYATESAGVYLIKDNTVEKISAGIQCWQGIVASNISNSMINNFRVEKNCIRHYQYGINLQKMNYPWTILNHVVFSKQAAIRNVNTIGGRIGNNLLSGLYNYSQAGISIGNSNAIRIASNTIYHFREAAYFSGAATHHHLEYNYFSNSDFGVVIDHNGRIGPQGSLNSPWDNIWTWFGLNYGKPHLQTRDGSDGTQSEFFTRNNAPFNPTFSNNIFAVDIPVNASAPYAIASPPDVYNCNGSGGSPNYFIDTLALDLQMMQSIAESDTAFILSVAEYNNQELLYKSIKDSTNLLNNNTILCNFVNNKENEDMGLICRVEEKILAGEYSDALAAKDSIFGLHNYEQNAKDLYTEFLAPYGRGEGIMDLTTTELNNIKDIAYLCPFTDGFSVYTARSICRLFDEDWLDYSHFCEQVTNPNVNLGRMAAVPEDAPVLNLYPNPATDIVFVQLNLENSDYGYLEIINHLGQEIGTYLIQNAEDFSIDISHLRKGLYLCKLIDANNEEVTTKKLTIN